MATPLLLYKFDEASSGTAPTNLLDSSTGTALNAAITYGAGNWVTNSGGRGLILSGSVGNGGVTAVLGSTKVQTALAGATKATWLVVVDTTLSSAAEGIASIINNTSGDEVFKVEVSAGGTQIKPIWNNAGAAGIAGITAGLHVVEVVVDTTQAVAADRVIVYIDGVATTMSATAFPAQNTAMDAFGANWANWKVTLGVYGPLAGYKGIIYFAALYATANTQAEVTAHATALLLNNDANPDAATVSAIFSMTPCFPMGM